METWFIIILSVITVIAVALLIFMSLVGDDTLRLHRMKHHRGGYINDQTAVIYQTITETDNSAKAYQIFVEYLFANTRHYLTFVRKKIRKIHDAYLAHDNDAIRKCMAGIAEMKIELKDQQYAQKDCLKSMDPKYYIENAAWIHLSNNSRFDILEGLHHIAEGCIGFDAWCKTSLPEYYDEQVAFMVDDICNICTTTLSLIGTSDIEGMRELRKRTSIILSESYDKTQRMYELLNDGRSDLEEDKRMALSYVLNNLHECHCMVYTLRRLVLCIICLTLSLKKNVSPRKK